MHLPWTGEELTMIRQQYNEQGMDVIQIANIHYKTPGQVAYRLKQIGAVDSMNHEIRGYKEYCDSPLFQEVKHNCSAFRKELKQQDRKSNKEHTMLSSRQEKRQTRNNQQEAFEMLSADVQMIKNDVKEILRLMNALYEFENQ
jgi:hypothetical protein